MADDLAAKLAHAFTLAASRVADRTSLAWSTDSVELDLAATLRNLLPACYFCHQPARTLEAGYAVCEPMFHDGQRRRLDDVPPVITVEPPDLARIGALLDSIRANTPPPDYSAPDYTPDERHRHTIGGQTWEHAHEGGHEAHSAVSHDYRGPGARMIVPAGTVNDLHGLAEDLDNGHIPSYAAEIVHRAANLLAPEAHPEPPSAVSEALGAARVFLRRIENITTEEFAHGREASERKALADALSRVDEAERVRRYALGEEHGAMGGTL
jgi:hypothetical protein